MNGAVYARHILSAVSPIDAGGVAAKGECTCAEVLTAFKSEGGITSLFHVSNVVCACVTLQAITDNGFARVLGLATLRVERAFGGMLVAIGPVSTEELGLGIAFLGVSVTSVTEKTRTFCIILLIILRYCRSAFRLVTTFQSSRRRFVLLLPVVAFHVQDGRAAIGCAVTSVTQDTTTNHIEVAPLLVTECVWLTSRRFLRLVLIKVHALILQISRVTVLGGCAGLSVVALADHFILHVLYLNYLLA